jgi:hypothetical protein
MGFGEGKPIEMRNPTPKTMKVIAWSALILGVVIAVVLAVPYSHLSDSGLVIAEPGSLWSMFAIAMGIFICYSLLKEARRREALPPSPGDGPRASEAVNDIDSR